MPHKSKEARRAWYAARKDVINAARRNAIADDPELRDRQREAARRKWRRDRKKIGRANAKWRRENRDAHLARRRAQYHATKVLKRKPKLPAGEIRRRRSEKKKAKHLAARGGVPWNHGRTLEDIPCGQCGKMFRRRQATSKFCSRACGSKFIRIISERGCDRCGKLFSPTRRNGRFCSRHCYRGARCPPMKQPIAGPPKPCTFCGAMFVPPYKRSKFCSLACSSRSRSNVKKAAVSNVFSLTKTQWDESLNYFDHRCAYCHKQMRSLTQDHIEPLSRNGQHVPDNVIPACFSCNASKNDRNIIEWLAGFSRNCLLTQ